MGMCPSKDPSENSQSLVPPGGETDQWVQQRKKEEKNHSEDGAGDHTDHCYVLVCVADEFR